MTRITDFPGYFITRTGEVWSERRNGRCPCTGPLRRVRPKTSGTWYRYPRVVLYKNSKRCTKNVHRLLAETFIPKPPGATLVRHLDDDPTNNDLTNLAWGQELDNKMDKVRNQTPFGGQKLMPVDVIFMRERRRRGAKVKDLATMCGVAHSNVSMICNRRQWRYLP